MFLCPAQTRYLQEHGYQLPETVEQLAETIDQIVRKEFSRGNLYMAWYGYQLRPDGDPAITFEGFVDEVIENEFTSVYCRRIQPR